MKKQPQLPRLGQPLSARESEIVKLACAGLYSKQICHELGTSKKTVDHQRRSLMVKTGSKNLVQLGVWASKNGFA